MTHFLKSDDKPDGYMLEDILTEIRKDVLKRTVKIVDDSRPEALHVLENNLKILDQLTQSINLAMDSTQILNKAFGPSTTSKGGDPRIGVA